MNAEPGLLSVNSPQSAIRIRVMLLSGMLNAYLSTYRRGVFDT